MSDIGSNYKHSLFSRLYRMDDSGNLPRTEKVIVFGVAFVIAISLWLLVNLNSDYSLSVNLPIQLAQFQDNQALAEEPPQHARVNIVGEGWKLINIYNNPPVIRVDPRQGSVNLFDRAKETMGMFLDVNVQTVQPMIINFNMEEKVTKRVPVEANVSLSLRRQFNVIGEPEVIPDSVEVSGARSLVEHITSWQTEEVSLEDVKDSVHQHIKLKEPSPLISLDVREVMYRANVSEFTEGEIRVYVRTKDLPEDRDVRFSPSIITIRYDVAIDDYARSQDIVPYEAYVSYEEILEDTTGYVIPTIESVSEDINLRFRSMQPRRVSYFNVVAD